MPPAITVIICTRDRPDDLQELVGNLLAQTHLPDQLIVVDSSEDDSLAGYFKALVARFEIQYLHTQPGVTRQRNIGIARSTGDLLFFFDDDVLLEPDYIERILAVFESDPEFKIGAVMGRVLYDRAASLAAKSLRVQINVEVKRRLADIFLHNKPGNGRFRYSGFPTHPQELDNSCLIESLSVGWTAFRRRVFTKSQFDENLAKRGYSYMDDADISKQLLNAGYSICYEASARLRHKKSRGGRISSRDLHYMQVLHYNYLFRKNWPQTTLRKLAFWWAILGFIVLEFNHPEKLAGALAGVRAILNNKDATAVLETLAERSD